MRPGRFDRHVLVDRPDFKGREAILQVHAKKVRMGKDVDLMRLAKLTVGFVGADLANLVNEAALLAARKDKAEVGMAELEEASERVIAGLEKSSRLINEDEKQRVAYVLQRPEDDRHLVTQTELINRICVALGGITAEEMIFNETSTGPSNDLEQATEIARRMVMDFGMSPRLGRVNYRESRTSPFLRGSSVHLGADIMHSQETLREIDLEIRRIMDECLETVRGILKSRRSALEAMTKALLEREVMSGEEILEILNAHKTGPQLMPGTSLLPKAVSSETTAANNDLPLKSLGQE
jgi:cell division protease FtsH